MEQELPWARWIIPLGNPVGLTTKLGTLLTGDDGNIYIACANNKAYAIEVLIKPGFQEGIVSSTPNIMWRGPYGLGYLPRLSHDPEPINSKTTPALLSRICSASKRDSSSFLRTNAGLEPFRHFLRGLDLDAWKDNSISLERISLTSKIDPSSTWKFDHDGIEYKAREIKMRKRNTDRVVEG